MQKFSLQILSLLSLVKTVSGFAPQMTPYVSSSQTSFFHVTPSSSSSPSFALQATNYYDNDEEEEDADRVKVPRRRQRGRMFENEEEESEFYDRVEERVYSRMEEDDDEEYDEDDDDDDEEEGDWNYDTFENRVIDNPILDAIDPDGAYARFPELARDPRFWIDMILFICFLNFLSAAGPQNTLPDTLWYPNGDTINVIGVNTPTPPGL